MKKIGDPHNFGRATSILPDGRIWKPRSIFFEEALLSPAGFLRVAVREVWEAAGGLVDALPCVTYEPGEDGASMASAVSLGLLPDRPLTTTELEGVSTTLAACLFLGAHDLHRENVICGPDQSGSLVFGPVDLECIFGRHETLAQTHLLPVHGLRYDFCGLAPIQEHLARFPRAGARARLIGGFCAALAQLNAHSKMLEARLLGAPGVAGQPIRVVFRPTGDYLRLLAGEGSAARLGLPLLPSEAEQLARGDVPYFLWPFGGHGVWYYAAPGTLVEVPPGAELDRLLVAANAGDATRPGSGLRAIPLESSALDLARFLGRGPETVEASGGIELSWAGAQVTVRATGIYSRG